MDSTGRRNQTRWTHVAILGAVCALVIGVYAWSATSGMIEFCGSNAKNTYYNLLVQGFRDGQLNLKTEVPPGLTQLADPYDPTANVPYRWIYGHPLHDASYYKGKLYLYFGITPALVLFWPYVALTGHYLWHKDAVMIFFSVGFLIGTGLLLAVWRRYFAGVSFWIVVAGVMALGLANFTPGILERCDVYEVAVSCGYAMTLLALAGIWGALQDGRHPWRWLAAASLAYGLALGARPSLLFGAVILLMPVAQAWRQKQRVWPLLMAAIVPMGLVGLGLMIYNILRFDNPLEFGQHYQLSAYRPDAPGQFSPRYLWFNFQVGFLEPARWSGHFPFVSDIKAPTLPKGATDTEHPFGVLTNIPLVWLALAVPLVWRGRSVEERSTLRWFLGAVALLFGICALTIGLHNSMCLRYEVEFAHVLVLLAVIGILGLERALAGQPIWRRAARCGWGLLLIFSVAFNLLAGVDLRAYAHNSLGIVFSKTEKLDDAITQFQLALQADPNYAPAQFNLGNVLLQEGKVDDAITRFQKVLQIHPGYAPAFFNLGDAFLEAGKLDEAIVYYQKAFATEADPNQSLQIPPDYAKAHYNFGNALLQKGKMDEAIAQYQSALQINPGYADAHLNIGGILLQKGKIDEAITQFQQELQIAPNSPQALNNLAWLLATCPNPALRNGRKAVELATQANTLTGGENPIVLHTLAAAFAEAGRFGDAVQSAQKAMALARAAGQQDLAGHLNDELKRYEAGLPLPQ